MDYPTVRNLAIYCRPFNFKSQGEKFHRPTFLMMNHSSVSTRHGHHIATAAKFILDTPAIVYNHVHDEATKKAAMDKQLKIMIDPGTLEQFKRRLLMRATLFHGSAACDCDYISGAYKPAQRKK